MSKDHNHNPNKHHGNKQHHDQMLHFPSHEPVEGCLNEKTLFYQTETGTERGDKLMAKVIHNLKLLMTQMEAVSDLISTFQLLEEKNQPGGYAGLDDNGMLDVCQIPVDELGIPQEHNDLSGRDKLNCHPISAIEGLAELLASNANAFDNLENSLNNYQLIAEKNTAGGYVGLDSLGKIDASLLPDLDIPRTTDDIVTSRSWTVRGLDVGGWKVGMEVPEGMTLTDLLTVLFTSAFPPVYTQPSLSLAGYLLSGTSEIGAMATVSLQPTYMAGSAGQVIEYRLYRNGNPIFTSSAPADFTYSFRRTEEPQEFNAVVQYAEGQILTDTEGVPSPSGHIPAGTIPSNVVDYAGEYMWYAGAQDISGDRTITPDLVLTYPKLSKKDVNEPWQISFAPPFNQIVIAYPASYPNLKSIYYDGGVAAGEYGDLFNKIEITVDATGYAPNRYKVYYWNLAASALGTMPFTLTFDT